MIDPKMLELSVYDGIPHLLTPVVTDPKKLSALKWAVREMEKRYSLMSKLSVRNIENYNERLILARRKGEILTQNIQIGFDAETGQPVFEEEEIDLTPLLIVILIDEVADLMLVAGKEIEAAVQRLAQMASSWYTCCYYTKAFSRCNYWNYKSQFSYKNFVSSYK